MLSLLLSHYFVRIKLLDFLFSIACPVQHGLCVPQQRWGLGSIPAGSREFNWQAHNSHLARPGWSTSIGPLALTWDHLEPLPCYRWGRGDSSIISTSIQYSVVRSLNFLQKSSQLLLISYPGRIIRKTFIVNESSKPIIYSVSHKR